MTNTTHAQERKKSPEEIELEKQSAIAKLKNEIAESELNAAKAKKEAEQLTAAQTEKEQAEEKKAVAEAEKATIEANRAKFKGPEVTVPTGKITSDGTFIESQILSQKALTKTFSNMTAKMSKSSFAKDKINKFVIYHANDLPAIELYVTMKEQVKAMESFYDKTNTKAKTLLDKTPDFSITDASTLARDPLLLGYAASGILRTAADLVSLFRTTTDFKNFDLVVDETTLASAFKQELLKVFPTAKVYFPSTYPVNTINSNGATSAFLKDINDIQNGRELAKETLEKIEQRITQLKQLLIEEKDPAKKIRIQKFIDQFTPIVVQLSTLNNSFDQLLLFLSTADATTKLTGQSIIMRAERMATVLNEADVYVVKFTVTSKGSNKISENLWRNARIEHSAGCELICLIFGPDGEIVFSDVESNYIPYTKSSEITN